MPWGLSLAACAQAQVRFAGVPRACAGGVGDATHTISLRVAGESAPLEFRLEGETGGATTVESDAASVRVRSGAQAATPVLVALRARAPKSGA